MDCFVTAVSRSKTLASLVARHLQFRRCGRRRRSWLDIIGPADGHRQRWLRLSLLVSNNLTLLPKLELDGIAQTRKLCEHAGKIDNSRSLSTRRIQSQRQVRLASRIALTRPVSLFP